VHTFIPTLGRWRQEDPELKASLSYSYITRPFSKKKKKKKSQKDFLFLFLKTGPHCVATVGLKLWILQPLSAKCWDDKLVPPH
jgi:hypothetical protein